MLSPNEIAALVAAFAGLLTAIKPFRNLMGTLWNKTIGRRGVQLNRIEAELHPNGGGSIKDVLNRIEYRQSGFEAHLTAKLNIGAEAIFRADPLGKLISINRGYHRLTGFTLEEVMGQGWVNIIHPECRENVKRKWNQAINEGIEFSEDMRLINPSGEEYKVHAAAFRELDYDGNIRGYLGVITPTGATSCPHMEFCLAQILATKEYDKP